MENDQYSLQITRDFLKEYGKLEQISKDSPLIYERFSNKYNDAFELYRHTRNVLTHNRVRGEYPLIVSKYMLEDLKEKIKWMSAKAINKCTKISQVESISLSTPIHKVISLMDKKNYSFLPIFVDGKVKYVISEKAILTILSDNKEGVIYDETITVENFLKYFELDNNPNEYYEFAEKDKLVYDLKEIFGSIRNGKRCGVVFVTQNGKPSESVLGIITLWDIAFTD